MTSIILAVPVRLDALFLEQDQLVIPPAADLSKLPYPTPRGDVNPAVAWLSEEIVTPPFESAALSLKAGLHLHWALPDSFLRGTNQGHIEIDPKHAVTLMHLSGRPETDRTPEPMRDTLKRTLLQDLKSHGIVLPENATVRRGDARGRFNQSQKLEEP